MEISTYILLSISILIIIAFFIYILRTKNHSQQAFNNLHKDLLEQEKQMMKDFHNRQMADLKHEYEKQISQIQRETIAQFEALSAKALKENTDGLKKTNQEQLDSILNPLKENIENFRNMVNEVYKNDNASREALSQQIKLLMDLNQTISEDAKNLTSALRGNSKVQGDWGEMILETLLENAGLEKGINYDIQLTRDSDGKTLRNEEGKTIRPDVVVYLPDGHKIIIDSKVSLTAFVDFCSSDNDEIKSATARQHIISIKKHIDELSVKKYQTLVDGAADYVMMFIPNEGAYITALQLESNLWKYAYDRHVVLVSPTHLYSVMSIVCQLWRQDKQNRYAIEIADRGGKLYDKVVLFINEFEKIGESIKKLQTSYDVANARLQERGSIIAQTEQLRNLGVKATKSMPKKFTNSATLDDDLTKLSQTNSNE